MDYIILNNDGSLNKQSLDRYINQGSHGVDKIFIGWANGLATDFLQAVFTLPNQMTNTVLGEFEENYNYDGEHTINGWVITLTDAQTTYNGLLMVSARIIRNGIVQVAYPFSLCINETGVRPETDSGVTLAQIDSYLLNLQNLVTGAVQANTDGAFSNTSENPLQNKVITAAFDALKRGSYTKVDTTEFPTLADFLDSEGEEGYLYLYPVDVNDEDEGYYQYIWENNTWLPLGTTKIDIANMVTTDTDQTISGAKKLTNSLTLYAETGDSPSIVLQRGTLSDSAYDWKITDIGGELVFKQLTGTENTRVKFGVSAILPGGTYSLGASDAAWKDLYLTGDAYVGEIRPKTGATEVGVRTNLRSAGGAKNIGNIDYPFGDLYFSGIINKNTSGFGLSLPITTSFTANSELVDSLTDQKIESNKLISKNNYLRFATVAGDDKFFYISSKNSNSFHIGATGIATGLILDTYLTNFSPDGNSQTLGTSSKKWNYVYADYLSDGTKNISVGNITTKIDTTDTYDVGAFDANGEITVDIATLEQDIDELGWGQELHGIYMLTYSYAQTIMYLDKTQIDNAALSNLPIRAAMPVVYNALMGNSVPGNIRVQKVGTNYVFKVSDGSQHAASGLHLFMVKTDLVQ